MKNILLSRKELEYIAHNFELTTHAKERIEQYNPKLNVKMAMLKSPLAWWNNDGTINISIDLYRYFVVSKEENSYKIITYKRKSTLKDFTVIDKFFFAYFGYKRIENKIVHLEQNNDKNTKTH